MSQTGMDSDAFEPRIFAEAVVDRIAGGRHAEHVPRPARADMRSSEKVIGRLP
ncbi:MAG: hypothetical protein IT386_06065 [Deltaproteobacteria bacterium]|nr:hypothetical protein [Deltaproteobacteria bacterium]